MHLSVGEVATATGGFVVGPPEAAQAVVTGVSVDTRSLGPGALFVALRAERDGHDFVAHAFGRGAVAALVERAVSSGDTPGPPVSSGDTPAPPVSSGDTPAPPVSSGDTPAPPGGALLIVVPDSAAALTALGRLARDRLEGVPVVGITGSSGKTSTKDLTAAALSSGLRVCASPGSFNNELGVPLTLLSADPGTGALVVEMGARGIGHIAELVAVARPTVGVITNIGMAHAEFFGSRADVAKAKGELVEGLPAGGWAVLCADDDMTPGLAARTAAPVLTAGVASSADVRVVDLRLDAELRPSFRLTTPWGGADVAPLPVRGAHQATNAALAVAVAGALGVSPEAAAAGLAQATGAPWRMELRRTAEGVLVLNDAYNANPASMAAALDALAALDGGGRRFAVLGHMAELGACSEEEHRRLGRLAAGCGVEAVVAVGPEAAPLAEGAREGGADVVAVEGPEAAVSALAGRLRPGDAVLVKASRVAGLERVAAALGASSFASSDQAFLSRAGHDSGTPDRRGDGPGEGRTP